MSGKFKFKGGATIQHINARKEGQEDDKELAVDLKLSAIIDEETMRQFDTLIPEFVFTDIGAVRNVMLAPIQVNNELEHYRFEVVESVFFGCRVKKFSINPKDGRKAELIFQVSFKPNGFEVATIAEHLQESLDISLEPENEELNLEGGGK